MNFNDYSNFLTESAKKNFENNNKYFEFDSIVFSELKPLIYQINNCLILEFYISALTTTNYLIERLLKIALIYNEVRSKSVEIKQLDDLYKLPNKKYIKLNFEKTIQKCRALGLIDDSEQIFLDKKIRPLVRNPYSHGDPTKITNTLPSKSKAYVGNLNNPGVIEEIEFEKHSIPTFQNIIFNDFAEKNAPVYFDFAFNLIFNIERKINYFHKK